MPLTDFSFDIDFGFGLPEWKECNGEMFELHDEFTDEDEAREMGEDLLSHGDIEEFIVEEEIYEDISGGTANVFGLYVR